MSYVYRKWSIPAHSNGTGQMFLEDKIHGFKYTYISDEHIVQQTKWYHSSIVLRKVHQFIIKKPMCYVKKAILQNPRFTTQVHTKHNQPRYTVYNLNWNQKQAGLTKSKHSIALSKAASYHKANHWS